jgi:hypothetical protein
MMRDETEILQARHVIESILLSYVRAELAEAEAAVVAKHLELCLACRILAARLSHAEITDPDDSAIARLTSAARAIPEIVRIALSAARTDPAEMTAGDVWRVGTDEAQLVWVRRVFEDSAAVVSVTLDVELADEYTLLIPADDSPISLDLAVMTTVEAHLDMRAFLQHIAALPVEEQITRLRQARRDGLPAPSDLLTGPPISRDDDQRLEYRQLIADLLADLSPAAYSDSDLTGAAEDGVDLHGLAEELNGLTWRRAGTQIRMLDIEHAPVDAAHEMIATALVEDLDAAVLIAVLTGAAPASILTAPQVARTCGVLLAKYPEADDVAVAIADEDWTSVVVTAAFAGRAVETPSGGLSEPRVAFQPMPLLDALLKHFDAHGTRWDEAERVHFDRAPLNVPVLAAAVSRAAVDRAIAEGRRAVTPAKKTAYMALDDHTVAAISALIESAVAPSTSSAGAVDAFLSGPRT